MGRKTSFRPFAAYTTVVLASFWLSSVCSAQRKIEVIGLHPNEEYRTAHHLRMSVEELRQTRELLELATRIVLSSSVDNRWQIWSLGNYWKRIHPRQARKNVETLLEHFQEGAKTTDDSGQYAFLTQAATRLLGLVYPRQESQVHYMQGWPARSDLEGSENHLEATLAQMKSNWAMSLAGNDPEAAFEMLDQIKAENRWPASVAVLNRFLNEGRFEDVAELAEDLMASYEVSGTSAELGWIFQMSTLLGEAFPDLMERGFELFRHRFEAPEGWASGQQAVRFETEEGSLILEGRDLFLMQQARFLGGGSVQMQTLMELFPAFAEQVQELGGVRYLKQMRQSPISSGRETMAGGVAGSILGFSSRPDGQKFEYRWGEAGENPAAVRARLRRVLSDRRDDMLAWQIIQPYCREDPDFSYLALSEARRFPPLSDDPNPRIQFWQNLLYSYDFCEGRVPDEVIERGFEVLAELRELEPDQPNGPSSARNGNASGHFERILMGYWIRSDFNEAMTAILSIKDDTERLNTIMAALERLMT